MLFFQESDWDDEYPVYHSIHDNFDAMKRFVDPEFRYHEVIGKLLMLSALKIADSVLLPFNVRKYGEGIMDEANEIRRIKNDIARTRDFNIGKLFDKLCLSLARA